MRMASLALRALLLATLAGCAALVPQPPTESLRIIAFNDFHGHLEPPSFGLDVPDAREPGGSRKIAAGGAAHLASAIRELKRGQANTAVVAAGDLVSASPLVSSIFLDEPSVRALSDAGLELSSVGNHEFDRGRTELERLQNGGCAGPQTCQDGAFSGARYRYVVANVFDTATGRTLFPPYEIKRYGGIPVAFVGAVLRSTPQIVSAKGISSLEFRDEAQSVNALVPELRREGVEAIVLLIHEGGQRHGAPHDWQCPGFEGAIVDIVKRLDPAVDIVVSGHTHDVYICRVDGRLVTSAMSYGRLLTSIDVTLDRATRDVVRAEARTVVVDDARFPADAAIDASVRRVAQKASIPAGRLVGRIRGEYATKGNAGGESPLGALVADSQLEAMRSQGVQAAFMNPGGLRAPLASSKPDGAVTFGDLYAVQPFGNTLVAMTLSADQVLELLEQQWQEGGRRVRMLQVAGIEYAWDGSRPLGAHVVRDSVRIGGEPLRAGTSCRIVVNSFLAGGGDGFTVLTRGRDVVGGPVDVQAMEAYLGRGTPERSAIGSRIIRIDAAR